MQQVKKARSLQTQWDPREENIYIWQEEKKAVLELTLEGEAMRYQAFQEEETACAKAHRQ